MWKIVELGYILGYTPNFGLHVLLWFLALSALGGRNATRDCETSDAEIGDIETGDERASESKIAFLRGLDTVYLLKIEL
jgi:hypothetical protein